VTPNDVLSPLVELARASFPRLYEPAPWSVGRSPVPALSIPDDHPALEALSVAVKGDESLARVAEAGEHGLFISASVGSGWRIQPATLPHALIGTAASRVLFSSRDPNDLEAFLGELEDGLRDFRALLEGEEVETLAITAFAGIALDPGITIETPWGVLRPPSEFEKQVRPFEGVDPSVIVETPIRLRYQVGDPDPENPLRLDDQVTTRLARLTQLLPLAVLLGIEAENYVAVDSLWTTTLLPGQSGWGYTGKLANAPRFRLAVSSTLAHPERVALAEWAARVEENYHESISVAVRRTVSAIRERVDPEDALIDAVIATENLFGHGGETEVTFRVTTAITMLLEAEVENRRSYQSRLRKVYTSRSTVVHGGSVPGERLNEHKETAVAVAVRSLRVLFSERPALIANPDRGIHLILSGGAAGEHRPND
jgi:hypothetical protein